MCGWNNNAAGRASGWMLWLLGAVLVTFPGCAKRDTSASDQTLRIAQRNEPATLDPHLATLPDEFFVIRALSEGLLTPNPDGGAPLPAMAESWNVSPDGLSYTFTLRAGVRWSNGDPVTAGDFVYSIQRALTPATGAPKAPLFFVLKHAQDFLRGTVTDFSQVGVSAHNERTLVFTLARPSVDFPSLVSSGPWIPVHRGSVETHGRHWTKPGHYVGNGMFTLEEWSPNRRIVVRKNPSYWDTAHVHLEAVHFLAFDNGDTEERAFRAGQLDVTMAVPFSKLDTYRSGPSPFLRGVPLHETRYLAINTMRAPLSDARVRRALSLSLNRQEIVDKVVKGDQRPAYNFVPPGLGGHEPKSRLTENLDEARRLLAEAGFPAGKGFPRLEVTAWGVGNQVLEATQQRWRVELGIGISVVQREARTHLAALAAGDFDIAFVAAIPDYNSPNDLLQNFTSGNAGNYPHWSNPGYDALIARHALAEAEALLLEELPLIPLYFNAKNFLLRSEVRGWREDALWTRYYKHVSLARE